MARDFASNSPAPSTNHVTSRGNHRQDILADSEERERFLGILAHTVSPPQQALPRLMDNHYHLLIETPEGNLSKRMRQVGAVYTEAHNRRNNKALRFWALRFWGRT